MKNLKQRIAELADDLKQRDQRIKELTKERDDERELVVQMRDHVEDAHALIDQWMESFGMVLDDDGKWAFPETPEHELYEASRDYRELAQKMEFGSSLIQPIVPPRNVGRPVAASEAQDATVLKLRKAGRSLRAIVEDTSLGLGTVRTIVEKGNGIDRATMRRLERIAPDNSPRRRCGGASAVATACQTHRADPAAWRGIAEGGEGSALGGDAMRSVTARASVGAKSCGSRRDIGQRDSATAPLQQICPPVIRPCNAATVGAGDDDDRSGSAGSCAEARQGPHGGRRRRDRERLATHLGCTRQNWRG